MSRNEPITPEEAGGGRDVRRNKSNNNDDDDSSSDLSELPPSAAQQQQTKPQPLVGANGSPRSPGGSKANYDRQQQTHSTIAELSEAFRMFTNINGIVPQSVISASDLQKIMEQAGMRTTDKDVASYIQAIDQNQIGNISFDEFASLMGRSVPIEEVDGLQAAFWGIDKDRKGWVTSQQFCELMASHGEQSPPDEVTEMLQFADPNNTGKVYYQVFLRMLGLRLR